MADTLFQIPFLPERTHACRKETKKRALNHNYLEAGTSVTSASQTQ